LRISIRLSAESRLAIGAISMNAPARVAPPAVRVANGVRSESDLWGNQKNLTFGEFSELTSLFYFRYIALQQMPNLP
jgi:hypothetical protein